MTRYKYDEKAKKLVETSKERKADRTKGDRSLWNDTHYDGARTTDGQDIGSRKKHRQYMRDNNLTTCDDYKNEWKAAEKARDIYRTRGGTITKRDIHNAITQLERNQNGK